MKANDEKNTLMKVLEFTAEKTIEMAKESPTVGEKIEIDGLTIIPISKVSAGFAGGGEDMADDKKKKNPAGVGAKVDIIPISFLVIEGGNARVVKVSGDIKDGIFNLAKTVAKKLKKAKPDKE